MNIKQWLAASVVFTAIALPVLAQNRTAPMNFAGRYLVSISDADMLELHLYSVTNLKRFVMNFYSIVGQLYLLLCCSIQLTAQSTNRRCFMKR
ncbi:MAG: hypothetical protein ACRC80_14075, partial [Waterburya sp.]